MGAKVLDRLWCNFKTARLIDRARIGRRRVHVDKACSRSYGLGALVAVFVLVSATATGIAVGVLVTSTTCS